jgi:hypothetical protein
VCAGTVLASRAATTSGGLPAGTSLKAGKFPLPAYAILISLEDQAQIPFAELPFKPYTIGD